MRYILLAVGSIITL